MVKFDKEAMKSKMTVSNLKSTGQSKFSLDEKEEVFIRYVLHDLYVYVYLKLKS